MAHSARATGAASLILYDVTTLHFENADEDDLRRVGMSKERRVDPQVQVGLLVDPGGFPLEVHMFEGNKARETPPRRTFGGAGTPMPPDNFDAPLPEAEITAWEGAGDERPAPADPVGYASQAPEHLGVPVRTG